MLLSGEGTGVNNSKYGNMPGCFGTVTMATSNLESTLFLSVGKIPVVLKPAIIFVVVMLFIQAFENRVEKMYCVTTFPGFCTINS